MLVALVHRGGQITVPSGATVLQAGDRITLLGEPDGILQLTETYRG